MFQWGVQHTMKKWTQQDLRFYNNEGPKGSNNKEKEGQQDRISRRKLVQIASKVSNVEMTGFCDKIDQLWAILSLEINAIETDRFFLQKQGVNKIKLGRKKGPNGIGKCQKWGSIEQTFPTMFKYGSSPQPLPLTPRLLRGL